MRSRLLPVTLVSLAAALSPLASSSNAAAATISGTVSGARGYTLLFLGRTHIVKSVKLNQSGRFSVNVPRDVTLQLLRPDNTFFGPVVVAHAGARTYEAVSGRRLVLGSIRLRAGYASPSRWLGMNAVDPHIWARSDRAGKPVGAGNLGLLVRRHGSAARAAQASGPGSACPTGSCPGSGSPGGGSPGSGSPGSGSPGGGSSGGGSPGGASSQPLPPGGDPTHVGIPTAFNADVTGAGVPNAENPASAQASGDGLFTELFMPLQMSVNTDAVGVTPAQVSDLVKSDLRMNFYLDGHAAGGAPVSGASVDCGTLAYCASGTGTGTLSNAGVQSAVAGARWDGSVPASSNSPGTFWVQIAPNVGTDQIHPGDVFLMHFHTPAGDVIKPTTLTMYFLTAPAVSSYDSGAGTQAVSYPVAQTAPGTPTNPIMMASGRLNLSLWRPQRAALPGEAGPFIDIGHLHYGAPVTTPAGSHGAGGCGAQFYSGLSPTLELPQSSAGSSSNPATPLHDTASDAPASAANRISFTLDVAGCLAAAGTPTTAPVLLPITAMDEPRNGGMDHSVQMLTVCLPGCDPSQRTG